MKCAYLCFEGDTFGSRIIATAGKLRTLSHKNGTFPIGYEAYTLLPYSLLVYS